MYFGSIGIFHGLKWFRKNYIKRMSFQDVMLALAVCSGSKFSDNLSLHSNWSVYVSSAGRIKHMSLADWAGGEQWKLHFGLLHFLGNVCVDDFLPLIIQQPDSGKQII